MFNSNINISYTLKSRLGKLVIKIYVAPFWTYTMDQKLYHLQLRNKLEQAYNKLWTLINSVYD